MESTASTTKASRRLVDLLFAILIGAAAVLTLVGVVPDRDGSRPSDGLLALTDAERLTFEDAGVEQLGREALGAINFPWRSTLPLWTVEFRRGDSEIAGYTWSRQQRIEVFIRPGDDSEAVARVLAHELGHALDVTLNDASERRQWLRERGASDDAPWWPTSGAADFETGAGDFAEVFAAWQTGTDDFRSRLAGPPDPADLELLAELTTQ